MNKLIKKIAEKSRNDFPLFNGNHNNLIYLDHAATSQKPQEVIDSLKKYYSFQNANVHRGAHQLSAIATEKFENARKLTANFINSNNEKEIIFTRNATEAINLVAYTWGNYELQENDEILISLMEHHSNIVPWQLIAKAKKCKLIYINIDKNGELDFDDFRKKKQEWKNRDHALFVGYIPYDDPQYAISVIIEHGGSGASTAAPIAKQVFNYIHKLNL